MAGRKVSDIGRERLRRKAKDLYVECPRCGRRTFMRHTRCQECGLWFEGEAFQFAPSEEISFRRTWLRRGARVFLALLLLAALAAVAYQVMQ